MRFIRTMTLGLVIGMSLVVSFGVGVAGADTTTTTVAVAADDSGGVSFRGPWTAVAAVAAFTILIILARRRLRASEGLD